MKFISNLSFVLMLSLLVSFQSAGKNKIIVVDAGHGGKDPGGISVNLSEKDITLSIAKKIQEFNSDKHIEIVLVRENDELMTLSERVEKINALDPDLLISLHNNWSEKEDKNGIEIFVCDANLKYKKSKKIAEGMLKSLPDDLAKGGVMNGNFEVIKNSTCPSLLLNIGYITNPEDKQYLETENGQNEIAKAILRNF